MHKEPQIISADRPLVFINMAITADGKIVTSNKKISNLGSTNDFARLLKIRSYADAILCGAVTLNSGPITLGNGGPSWTEQRLARGMSEAPVRVLVTGSGSLSLDAEVFKRGDAPIFVVTTRRASQKKIKKYRELSEDVYVQDSDQLNWPEVLYWLSRRGVSSLLCEGGGELNAGLIERSLVDGLFLTICPWIAGGSNASTLFEGSGIEPLCRSMKLELLHAEMVGEEWMTTWCRPSSKERFLFHFFKNGIPF
jgi:2,5-diamino-6-(ribosylamino)-4(3H)-pyrimidinone 5'-phosphate reductase